MKPFSQPAILVFLLIATPTLSFSAPAVGIQLSDPNLEAELIDTDETEFFISHAMDFSGRLYVGCREALFIYEPASRGGFGARQELYRFPKDTWLYDLETHGDDLLVLTNTSLYRMPGIVAGETDVIPEKILWGSPLGHHHQGLHAIEFGPDGDLYLSFGDPQPHLHWDRDRPDHLWHWTFYMGSENKPIVYNGVGAILRLKLAENELSVHSSGLRNPCGISFDPNWRLFANDNDQEGGIASPCKLVYAPAHSWQGWVRGWAQRHNPKRLDMLPVANLELDVPVGQCWYDDTALGEQYRGSLMVANWGNRTISWHTPEADGAGFVAPTETFLTGEGVIRPLSAMPTNDGRLIATVCYMQGNESSPVRRTDLLLIRPKEGSSNHRDVLKEPLRELLDEPWQLRAKAHQEILRLSGDQLELAASDFLKSDPADPAFSSLIFLAARKGATEAIDRIKELAHSGGPNAALALRVAASYPNKFPQIDGARIAAESSEPETLLALLEYLHAAKDEIDPTAVALATHTDPFVRQSAIRLLAKRASDQQLAEWINGEESQRLIAVLAAGFRIWDGAEQATGIPAAGVSAPLRQLQFSQADGKIDLTTLGKPVGIFTLFDWWQEDPNQNAFSEEFAILERGIGDSQDQVRTAAAVNLFFLNDDRVDQNALAILREEEIDLRSKSERFANPEDRRKAELVLADAQLSTDEEVPSLFSGYDWEQEATNGDSDTGKQLFADRGCIACHLTPDSRRGGSIGPSLFGVMDRFTPAYLAESILLPNQVVSPNFHPATLTLTDGATQVGFIEAENGGEISLRIITGQIQKIPVSKVEKRDISQHSMMPAGLIQTPEEMRDLLAYLKQN